MLFNKLKWRGAAVDVAVPVGARIPPRALQWLKQFAEQHGRPLIYAEQIRKNGEFQKQQELIGYGPPEFQAELAQWQKQGIKLW